MDKDIIRILEENRLYDDNYSGVYVNKAQDFLQSYKLNKGHVNKIPKSIKRDNNGFLLLDFEPYIISDLETGGHNEKFWMVLSNGSRVLLKSTAWVGIQNELLFKYLCKWLDVPCASVDVATYCFEKYLLSPSFLGINEYLFDYYDLYKSNDYSIDVARLIEKAMAIKQDSFVRKMLIVDILAQQQDRFPANFKVVKNSKKTRICPLFDNEILEINSYMLRDKTYPSINLSANDDDVITYLLEDHKFKQWCLDKIISRQIPDFREMIRKDKGIYIDDSVSDSFNKTVKDGKTLILDNYKYN